MAIRKTRGGRYEIDFRDADGKRHQKTFDRLSDAERAYNQVQRDVWAGSFISPRKARTFSEVAAECLLSKASLRPNTVAEWSRHVSKLEPYLGRVPVALAVPKMRLMLRSAEQGRERALLMTVALTGLRAGEFLALRWPDIDLEAGQLHVRRKLTWVKCAGAQPWGQRYEPKFFRPKTKSGVRTLPIPPELVSELRRWKLKCAPGELDLVFPNQSGEPEHEKNVLQGVLWPALQRARVRRVNMKCLRHTFASILIMKRTPVSEVQSYMGHATAGITLGVYTHWFKNWQTGALDRLAEELIPGIGQAVEGLQKSPAR